MLPRFTHIARHVVDLDKTIAFLCRYCGLNVVHDRTSDDSGRRVVWLAEPGKEDAFVFVLIPGNVAREQNKTDYSHLGFALASREEVDAVAAMAKQDGILVWEPREEPYPVGYYCGVRDPDGQMVEFSYGQPLGPT